VAAHREYSRLRLAVGWYKKRQEIARPHSRGREHQLFVHHRRMAHQHTDIHCLGYRKTVVDSSNQVHRTLVFGPQNSGGGAPIQPALVVAVISMVRS
jgi:hypothetical protein